MCENCCKDSPELAAGCGQKYVLEYPFTLHIVLSLRPHFLSLFTLLFYVVEVLLVFHARSLDYGIHARLTIVMHGLVQSGASSRVAHGSLGAFCQQPLHHLPMPIHTRPMQGSVPLGVGDVRVLHWEKQVAIHRLFIVWVGHACLRYQMLNTSRQSRSVHGVGHVDVAPLTASFSRSTSTTSRCPFADAKKSAVRPSTSTASGETPWLR
mmetsp:Transcript_9270/g.22801  ORF Transcript_9270/g.22801 Transcript_9270/m.22801 type:complete len:209 (-) Transcript_9270:192-818(-)